MKDLLSVVVPVYNEEGNVAELARRLHDVLSGLKKKYEIIFVDDASSDNTFEVASSVKGVTVIRHRKNSGQTAALRTGFEHSQGDIIITMDGDLQDDPSEIPLFLEKLNEGWDVVCGWRKKRKDVLWKHIVSRIANKTRRFLLGDKIHDSGCTFRVQRADAVKNLDLYGEMHRFLPALMRMQGFRITEIKVAHHERKWGKTKYGMNKVIKGFLDILSVWFWKQYASKPNHLFGGIGLITACLGFLLGVVLFILRAVYNFPLSNSSLPLLAIFFVVFGWQFIITGILSDISIRSYRKLVKEKNISRIKKS